MALSLIIFPLLLIAYYAIIIVATRQPRSSRAVVVRYEPPSGLSAAGVRFVWKGVIDERTIACVFAGLATKGRISIERERGSFKITKTNPPATSIPLTPEEQRTMEWLFSNFLESTVFEPNSSSQGCIMSLRGLFDGDFCRQYQTTRTGYVAIGVLASLFGAFAVSRIVDAASSNIGLIYMLYASTLLAGFVVGLTLFRAVADFARGIGSVGRVIFGVVVSALPIAGVIGVAAQLNKTSNQLSFCVCSLALINVVAIPFLRSATPKGIETRQQIEGFREYLVKVEQDRLDRMIKPKSPHIPNAARLGYAIALEVKEAWGDDLANACYPG